jgi:hypothetical protein
LDIERLCGGIDKVKNSRLMRRSNVKVAVFSWLCLAALVSGCNSVGDWSNPVDGHPIGGPIPSIKEHYDQALAQARTWHSDAAVFWAQVDIWNGQIELMYRFKSVSFPGERYLVHLELSPSGTEMTVFEGSFEGPDTSDPAISLDDSILDSTQVADLALSHGAREFITKHPSARRLLIQLCGLSGAAADELGLQAMRPTWRVGISDLPLYSINLLFDPYSGEFLGSILRE